MSLTSGLSFAVKKQGHKIDVTRTILEIDTLWVGGPYDLAILDVSPPDGFGFGFCGKVHRMPKVPVMFPTAADERTDIIMGLDMGGNDHITKPFKLAVFLSKINTFLRRGENSSTAAAKIGSGGIHIRLLKGTVCKNGKRLDLTASEYKSLCLFVEHPDQTLSPDQILSRLWDCNEQHMDSGSPTVYIRRLRMEIEDNPGAPERTVMVHDIGYK